MWCVCAARGWHGVHRNWWTQVHLVLGTSIVMGFIFGLIFGVMDVEDKHGWALRNALIHEEHYCLPIGLVIGGIAGYFNSCLLYTSPSPRDRG